MNTNDLLNLETGDAFEILCSLPVTKELIHKLAEPTGFDGDAHILGRPSAMSKVIAEDNVAFMCGAGTTIMMYRALWSLFYEVWGLDPGIEKLALKCDSVFSGFNPEGGQLSTMFIAGKVKPSRFSHLRLPSVLVPLEFVMVNSRRDKIRVVIEGNLLLQFVEDDN